MRNEYLSYMVLKPSHLVSKKEGEFLKTYAAKRAIERALYKGLAESDRELWVREIRPSIDLPVVFTGIDHWIFPSPPIAIPVVDTTKIWINEKISQQCAIVFYGIGFETDNTEISSISFSNGNGLNLGYFNFESFRNQKDTTAFFSFPIVYDPGETIKIEVINRIPISPRGILMRLLNFVIEPVKARR